MSASSQPRPSTATAPESPTEKHGRPFFSAEACPTYVPRVLPSGAAAGRGRPFAPAGEEHLAAFMTAWGRGADEVVVEGPQAAPTSSGPRAASRFENRGATPPRSEGLYGNQQALAVVVLP